MDDIISLVQKEGDDMNKIKRWGVKFSCCEEREWCEGKDVEKLESSYAELKAKYSELEQAYSELLDAPEPLSNELPNQRKNTMDNDIMENENVEIKEMGFVFTEDVAEPEQAYSELLEALKAISNLYRDAQQMGNEMDYTALTMAVIANNAIAQSKEKYNE